MAVIPAGHCEITLNWNGLSPKGSDPKTVLGFETSGDIPTAPLVEGLADFFQPLLNALDSSWAVPTCTLRIGAGSPPYGTIEVPTAGLSGAETGDAETPNTAVLVQKSGGVIGGRANRGRMYLPGCPTSAVNEDGVLDSDFLGAMQANVDTWMASMPFEGLNGLVILHSEGSPVTDPTAVSFCTVSPNVASQRRRQRR